MLLDARRAAHETVGQVAGPAKELNVPMTHGDRERLSFIVHAKCQILSAKNLTQIVRPDTVA